MFEIQIVKDELPPNAAVQKRTAVRAVVFDGNKLLMVETNRGDYKFPGGGVEQGETLVQALIREIAEETGYTDVEIGPCVGTAFEQNEEPQEPGTFFQMKSIYYVCRLLSDTGKDSVPDRYEEKPGFQILFIDLNDAYAVNKGLMEKNQNPAIPWLERETTVLKRLQETRKKIISEGI